MKASNLEILLVFLVLVVLIVQIFSLIVTTASVSTILSSRSANTNYTITHQSGLSQITISASGTASAQPTTATIYATAQGMGGTGLAATANLTIALSKMNSSILKYLNGNVSDIKTTYYNLYNQTSDTYYCNVPCTTYNGFIASEQLQITVPNARNLSGAVGSISAINGIQITSASATLSNTQITTLRSSAFEQALQNATSQAEALTGNATLNTQNITVGYYNVYPLPYALASAGTGGASSSSNVTTSPTFYSGTDSVTESISVVFSYNKK